MATLSPIAPGAIAPADDIALVIRALGLSQVDLRGGDPKMEPKVPEVAPNPVPTAEDFLYLFFGRSKFLEE